MNNTTIIDPQLERLLDARYVPQYSKAPQQLATFTQANLPSAVTYLGCIVYVSDKQCVGVSNGTTWTRADGTAL